MVHDARGRTVSVGSRRRTVPASLRRALEWRDHGCRFPGCGITRVDAHHVRHWADGGATRLDNLLLLCRRHHRAVHEDGYRVTLGRDGEPVFWSPDGRVLPEVPRVPGGATMPAGGAAIRALAGGGVVSPNRRCCRSSTSASPSVCCAGGLAIADRG
jgi:hypothetical protein